MTSAPDRLRIGLDGYNLAMARGTGVATYARTLARAIQQRQFGLDLVYGLDVSPKAREEIRETLFFARLGENVGDASAEPKASLRRTIRRAMIGPGVRDLVSIPVTGRVIARSFEDRLPTFDRLFTRGGIFQVSARYFRRYRRFMTLRMPDPPDIMHWTYPLPLRLAGARNIYTIHDLVPLRLPYTSLEDKQYYDRLIGQCIATADRIVTVSEASRNDILSLFSANPEQIVNSYQSADVPDDVSDDSELARRLDRLFDLKRDGYLLFVGAIEPKKNVGRMIEAYLGAEIATPLVIVGSGGWSSDGELRLLSDANGAPLLAARQVRRVAYLPRPLLIELVRGAKAVLFPSLYEGFGLPALEAMALGVPVLTGNTGSLPEVVGDAAMKVDPYDVPAMTNALRQMDKDDALRQRLRNEGPVQAARFSGAVYARRIDEIYRSLAAKQPRT